MKHTSIKLEVPCEFINITEINPLISHVEIKVLYVGEQPNRNKSVITKEVATQMANTLPGSPIVGLYNETKEDFEEHNKVIEIANGTFKVKDSTRPYGFVDLNAKCWFQKFLDDNEVEREYLMTEGYLWTGQYPEAQRVIDKGNNQSMELDGETLDATWAKDINGKPKFFIINEAIISKLCILGEDVEPCFEGATIKEFNFSYDESFKNTLFSMIKEIKDYLKEGGNHQMFTEYAVSIGDELWGQLYDYLVKTYPQEQDHYCSKYGIEGIYEESGAKFAVIRDRQDGKYYRLNMQVNESGNGFEFSSELIEVTKTFVPAETPQFALEEVEAYEAEYKKKTEEEEKEKGSSKEDDNGSEEEKEGKEEEKKKKEYSLEEIPEYVQLLKDYEQLQNSFNEFKESSEKATKTLNEMVESLKEFKSNVEKEQKEDMINNTFYMLSNEDKKDVIDHINEYSLDEIEAKLAVICVRNKVNFSLDDDNKEPSQNTSFNLNSDDMEDTTPEWIKAIRAAEKD